MTDYIELINLALTGILIPYFTNYIKTKEKRENERVKKNRREAKKMLIFTLISNDKTNYLLDKRPPQNMVQISKEFDIYIKDGGNSWIVEEVERYKEWVKTCCKNKNKKL